MRGGDESDGANVHHSGHPNNLGKLCKIQLFARSFCYLTEDFTQNSILALLNYD